MLRIPKEEAVSVLKNKLIALSFKEDKANTIAEVFVENSLQGVYSHGINRFSRFIRYIHAGVVNPDAEPMMISAFGGMQQWDGRRGPGILNAIAAVNTALTLAEELGIGAVAMGNTNHWMRGGTYGRIAAKAGYIFIGWTNTIANLPAWGALDRRLGNNPLVLAAPGEPPIVIDMAMSQYSYGKLELSAKKGESLPLPGGYDELGLLTVKPDEILRSGRPLPVGYWKGAGLSLMLDILATILSDGMSTAELSRQKIESGVSQVFIAINPASLHQSRTTAEVINMIIEDYKNSIPENDNGKIIYPGERSLELEKDHLLNGIPVLETVWQEILRL